MPQVVHSTVSCPRKERRMKAPKHWIENTIEAAQRHGLTVTKVCHLPDGATEVHFGEFARNERATGKGWDI